VRPLRTVTFAVLTGHRDDLMSEQSDRPPEAAPAGSGQVRVAGHHGNDVALVDGKPDLADAVKIACAEACCSRSGRRNPTIRHMVALASGSRENFLGVGRCAL